MFSRGGAACAAILVLAASIYPAAAKAQSPGGSREVRLNVREIDWSDPEAVERLHQNIERAARTMCNVADLKIREVRRCVALTVEDAFEESGNQALRDHWRNCPNRLSEAG